jgi:hypothetical protein
MRFPVWKTNFSACTTSRSAVESAKPRTEGHGRGPLGRRDRHMNISTRLYLVSSLNIAWSYICTPSSLLIAWYLIKHRDDFMFMFVGSSVGMSSHFTCHSQRWRLRSEWSFNTLKNEVRINNMYSFRTSQETQYFTTTKTKRLMLFGETVAVYWEREIESGGGGSERHYNSGRGTETLLSAWRFPGIAR